ncbi:MAG: ABC transporter ATP-binding protein, partial [Clostridia bacterium]|nr:ABC transporter ATP-binding protein [Clostridia bacterium]
MFKKIAPAVRGYWKETIISPLLMIGEVIMECLIPITMGNIVDKGIYGNDINYVVSRGLLMVFFALVSLFCGSMAGRFSSIASVGFARNLRKMMFEKIQTFSFANVDKFSTGSLITRLTNDVTNTQMAFMMCIRMVFRAPITFIVAIIMCLKLSPKLSLSFTVFVPIIIIAAALLLNLAFPRFNAMLKSIDAMNTDVQENLTGIRIVKAFVRGDFERKKFNKAAKDVKDTQVAAEKIVIWTMPIMQFCMYACNIVVAWFGAHIVLGGGMGTGALMSFFTYIAQILMSLMMISMIFMQLVISRASIKRIVEIIDETPDIDDGSSKDNVKDGEIEFRNVSFSYNKNRENPTLKNISLHIKSGQTVGVIGGTGSGKSSLVQLIPRLYDVLEGEVYVGGKNVKDYNLTTLRDAVSMVLQKNVLFSGTIEENLRWGNENATEEQIIEACKAAQAHDFVMSF